MMSEKGKQDAEQVEQTEVSAKVSQAEQDQVQVEVWTSRASQAPTLEALNSLAGEVDESRKATEKVEAKLYRAVVERASVFGWQKVADEMGVSARQVHVWHREFAPEVEDVSAIPATAMAREQRRIDRMNRRLEAQAEVKRKRDAAQKRLDALKEGLSK